MSYKFARKSGRRSGGRMGYSKSARAMVVRGYTRSQGLYGRFNRPARKPEAKAIDWIYAHDQPSANLAINPENMLVQPRLLNPNFMWRGDTAVGGTGNTHLLEIKQGPAIDERIGRKIQVRSLEIQGSVYLPPVTNLVSTDYSTSEIHHMWIVIDTQVNGSQNDQATQIWQGVPWNANAGPSDAHALRNLSNSGRFRVLKHIVTPLVRQNFAVTLTDPTPTQKGYFAGEGIVRPINCFLKLNLPIEYSNVAPEGSIQQLRDNGIFIFTCAQPCQRVAMMNSSTPQGGGELIGTDLAGSVICQESYFIRIRYTDV